jgi:hypothetical protein
VDCGSFGHCGRFYERGKDIFFKMEGVRGRRWGWYEVCAGLNSGGLQDQVYSEYVAEFGI